MDTKLKNIKYSIGIKFLAFIILWLSILSIVGSCLYYGYYYDELTSKTYYDTNEFQWSFANLVHNAVELSTQLESEEKIKASEESKEVISNQLNRLNRIHENLSNTINFKYYIINTETGEYRTNIEDIEGNEAITLLENQTTSVYFDHLQSDIRFPMNGDINKMLSGTSYEVYAAIVEPLQPGDSFFDNSRTYYKVNYLLQWVFILFVASLILMMITFVYLVWVAGRKEKDGTIELTFIDKIYTDIHLILVAFAALCSAFAIREFSFFHMQLFMVSAFILLGIDALIGLSFIFSMIRQIKNRQLFKNSLIYRFFMALSNIFKMIFKGKFFRPIIIILLLAYGLLNGILLAVLISAFDDGTQAISSILLLALNIFAVYYTAKSLKSLSHIMDTAKEISAGNLNYASDASKVSIAFTGLLEDIQNIQAGLKKAVVEAIKGERMKTDLITNVSHDLKTPLTSIITYVDLLKNENLNNEKAEEFVSILDEKSLRLKYLVEDLVEASKASSGSLTVKPEKIDLHQLMLQALGEYEEKIEAAQLDMRIQGNDTQTFIYADGKHMWRIVENLLSNVIKYSLNSSRVYIEINKTDTKGQLIIKNISASPLDISPEQLTERFVRGDTSRTTEGSGLGLSIAESLTKLQGGDFSIQIDGDLFKTIIDMPLYTD